MFQKSDFPVLEHPFLLCPVLSRVPSRILAVPAHPVLDFGYPGPSRPLARFLACPVVPLSRDKEETPVPLSQKFVLSRPVGNPSFYALKFQRYRICNSNFGAQDRDFNIYWITEIFSQPCISCFKLTFLYETHIFFSAILLKLWK